MATPTKWGKEFLVNTGTKGFQGEPNIAGLLDGRFVVAWNDETGDKSKSAVRAQIFNADGSPAGEEFRINKTTLSYQSAPTISVLADGGFVVAYTDWSESVGDTFATDIRAQIFKADGSTSGAEFRVNTTTGESQYGPTVTGLAHGGFVVAWTDSNETNDVKAQIFSADGVRVGGEFQVNTTTLAGQPAITSLSDGRFVVAWSGLDYSNVGAQIFNADGSKAGGELLVNAPTDGGAGYAAITELADGRFVVTWRNQPFLGNPTVQGQVFNADGSKSGENFVVNTTYPDSYYTSNLEPTITALADGRFVIVWPVSDERMDLRAQVFNADGTKSGSKFLVNTTTTGSQADPTITALADGRFIIAWTDHHEASDGSESSIKGQVFDPREEAIDLDGSDRGDQFVGTRFADIINGEGGNDWLLGGKGRDLLGGQERKDKLKGGGGADQFIFGEIGKQHADKLVDLKPGEDLILLDGTIFTGIGSELGRKQFEIGRKADDSEDRIIYDKGNGKLLWDADGKGGSKEVLFANVDPGLKLSADDFSMV